MTTCAQSYGRRRISPAAGDAAEATATAGAARLVPGGPPGGLAIGETYVYEDGLKIRVDRLGLLPLEPPQTIFDEDKQYVSAEAIRFEVTVTNEGGATASLSDLAVGVRAGKDGWPGDETWNGTRVLRGKLLPGASATGTYT